MRTPKLSYELAIEDFTHELVEIYKDLVAQSVSDAVSDEGTFLANELKSDGFYQNAMATINEFLTSPLPVYSRERFGILAKAAFNVARYIEEDFAAKQEKN